MVLHPVNFPEINYRPQRSCGQGYVFTRVCDSVNRGGLPQCMLGYHPLGRKHPPTPQEGSTHTPGKEAPPPERQHPPWEGSTPPRHTVNKWPVHILLECILVLQDACPYKVKGAGNYRTRGANLHFTPSLQHGFPVVLTSHFTELSFLFQGRWPLTKGSELRFHISELSTFFIRRERGGGGS